MQIVVIGAGVVGALCAYRLARAGHAVTVVERDSVAAQASGRSFGWINASYHLSEAHFGLRNAAIDAHKRLEAEIGAYADWCGALEWDLEGAVADRLVEKLTALGYPVERLDRAGVAAREPALAAPPEAALFLPREGAADPGTLAARALVAAAGLGARVVTGLAVERLATRGSRVVGVATAAGLMAADMVVIAAGTGTTGLVEQVGGRLPMPPRPGVMLRTLPVDIRVNHVLVAPEGEIRQLPDGSLLHPVVVGHIGDNAETVADPAELGDAALARLRALFDRNDIAAREIIVGWRPFPEDGLPAVGPVGEGAYAVVTHSGATLAPILAEAVADEIADHPRPELAPFRPARFG